MTKTVHAMCAAPRLSWGVKQMWRHGGNAKGLLKTPEQQTNMLST